MAHPNLGASRPTVTLSTNSLSQEAATLTINGTYFSQNIPTDNTVVFNLGASGVVTSATNTSLVVTFSEHPMSLGVLTAVVTSFYGTSGTPQGTPVQVATVVAATPSIPTTVTGAHTINDADDGSSDNVITFSDNMTVTSSGDLLLNVDEMGKLAGDKIITIKPQGKIHLTGGRTVTVLDGTKGKVHTKP